MTVHPVQFTEDESSYVLSVAVDSLLNPWSYSETFLVYLFLVRCYLLGSRMITMMTMTD